MKKVILNVALATVFTFVTVGVFAQEAKPTTPPPAAGTPASGAPQATPQPPRKPLTPEERADRTTMGLTKRLNLTTEQVPKIKELFLTSIKQEEADRKTAGGDKDKFRELSKARDEARKAGIKKVLTPEQWTKFDAPPPAPAPKAGNPGDPKGPTPKPAPGAPTQKAPAPKADEKK